MSGQVNTFYIQSYMKLTTIAGLCDVVIAENGGAIMVAGKSWVQYL